MRPFLLVPYFIVADGGIVLHEHILYIIVISDPRRGRYMVLIAFNFFSSSSSFLFFSFFFPPRFCPRHISGTVTRRDSKLSVLLGPAV